MSQLKPSVVSHAGVGPRWRARGPSLVIRQCSARGPGCLGYTRVSTLLYTYTIIYHYLHIYDGTLLQLGDVNAHIAHCAGRKNSFVSLYIVQLSLRLWEEFHIALFVNYIFDLLTCVCIVH